MLACAWIVAFFPVLANTTLGLNSVDHNLRRPVPPLWRHALAGAVRPQAAGGAAVYPGRPEDRRRAVADRRGGRRDRGRLAGAGSGLAYRIVESGYRLNIPRMFAALLLLSVAGIVIFFALSLLSHLLLRRWHESAIGRGI